MTSCCATESIAVELLGEKFFGDTRKTQRRGVHPREGDPSRREGFRVCRAPPPAGNPPRATPVYGGTKRSYENIEPIHLRSAVSSTPSRRGSRGTGGTGTLQHHLSFIRVQYRSSTVQQYSAAQQYSSAVVWHYSSAAPAAHSEVLCSKHHFSGKQL